MASLTKISALEFGASLRGLLDEYGAEVTNALPGALAAGAEVLRERLAAATPVRTGRLQRGWKADAVSPRKLVVYNTAKSVSYQVDASGRKVKKGIGVKWRTVPLINIVEYGSRGKPFVAETVAASRDAVGAAIIGGIEKALSQ